MGRFGRLVSRTARLPARAVRAFPRFLNRPFPRWLALLQTALLLSLVALATQGAERELVKEVRVVERIPGSERVIVKTVYVCRGDVKASTRNEVTDAKGKSGDADTSLSADASGDVGVAQAGQATSGAIILGQRIDLDASCSTVNLNAVNQVSDVRAETGRAEVKQRVKVVYVTPEPTASPEVVEILTPTASPTAVTPSQSPPA